MTFNYLPLQAKASELITKFGIAAVFTRTTEGAFDPATGTKAVTTSTFNADVVTLAYSVNEIGLDTIQSGDLRVYAQSADIRVNDKMTIGTDSFRVIRVTPIQPADVKIYVELQVRR